jgi:hypothetical protein
LIRNCFEETALLILTGSTDGMRFRNTRSSHLFTGGQAGNQLDCAPIIGLQWRIVKTVSSNLQLIDLDEQILVGNGKAILATKHHGILHGSLASAAVAGLTHVVSGLLSQAMRQTNWWA